MNWGYCDGAKPSIPLVIHQKIANILIRQTLEVTKPKNGSIKDTLGLNKAKLDHITYLHTQLSRLLLNPLFRKSTSGPDPEFHEPELLEAHSNPLLGPAVLNSSVPACAYLLATMLDSRDSDPNSRIEKLVETGLICINQPGATILAVRCLEICFKIMEAQSEETMFEKSLSQIAQAGVQPILSSSHYYMK